MKWQDIKLVCAVGIVAGFLLIFTGCASTTTTTTATDGTTSMVAVSGWDNFLAALKKAAHTGLTALQTVAKACWTITQDLTADEFASYLTAFGVDAATVADAKAAYITAGATAAAAQKIAASIDGATVSTSKWSSSLRFGLVGRLAESSIMLLRVSMKIVVLIIAAILFACLGTMAAGVWALAYLKRNGRQ